MATKKETLDALLSALRDTDGITARPMMGEYLLYFHGKLFGGLYDDRLLLKPTPSLRALLPDAPMKVPYDGAKTMLISEDWSRLPELLAAAEKELPEPKKKKK